MTTSFADNIPIELLTFDTWIMAPAGPARAIDIRFDGSGYAIDLRYGERDDGYEEFLYVDAGGSVEFAGVGEPKLLDQRHVTPEEWEAKAEAGPVNLLDATRAAGLRPDLNTVAALVCAALTNSYAESIREREAMEAAE